jgi:hypothetical protein
VPGPLSTGKARRANAPHWTPSTAGQREAPPWPEPRKATKAELERWELLWASEAASQWVDADAPAIARVVKLQLESTRPDGRLGAFAALVALEDRFGLSASARRRNYVDTRPLEWVDEDDEDGSSGEVVLSVVS